MSFDNKHNSLINSGFHLIIYSLREFIIAQFSILRVETTTFSSWFQSVCSDIKSRMIFTEFRATELIFLIVVRASPLPLTGLWAAGVTRVFQKVSWSWCHNIYHYKKSNLCDLEEYIKCFVTNFIFLSSKLLDTQHIQKRKWLKCIGLGNDIRS